MNTPIFTALEKIATQKAFSFHTPGHKSGRSALKDLKKAFGESFFNYDLTEISGLDNLLLPEGIIKESQENLSKIHHGAFARYLLGGTTQGLLASLMALAKEKEVFIPRHAHRSIYHGLILARATPHYLMPTLDNTHHIPLGLSLETLKEAIRKKPHVKTLVLVHPTYHGITYENEALVRYAKEKGLYVIVDEAHGAHFSFSEVTPASLIEAGADLVIKSYHKTLPSLTQGSVLVGNDIALEKKVDSALRLIATTSPSYPILASMELASIFMHKHGAAYLKEGLEKIACFKASLNLKTISIVEDKAWKKDPFRLWLKSDCLNGTQLQNALEKEKLYIEMSDDGILLLLPLDGNEESLGQLKQTLEKIDKASLGLRKREVKKPFYKNTLPKVVYPLCEAYDKESLPRLLKDSLNFVSAQFLQAYPPGIPQIVPGEIIDEETIRLWQESQGSLELTIDVIS